MKVCVCELDNRDERLDAELRDLSAHLAAERPDLLLLPEMCFAEWLAADRHASAERWNQAAAAHRRRIDSLENLTADAVIGTRPAVLPDGARRNLAWLWTRATGARDLHAKTYLPNEPGYWEANWYGRGPLDFETGNALGLTIGILICTEMWFFEWARHFARAGAELLCVPRATPQASVEKWLAGGRAAAVCAGAWCLSSNLWNPPGSRADCGGLGWIISPEGDVLARTDRQARFVTCEIDIEFARSSKSTYPRYVAE